MAWVNLCADKYFSLSQISAGITLKVKVWKNPISVISFSSSLFLSQIYRPSDTYVGRNIDIGIKSDQQL